jgi:hypothetical protein
VNIINWLGYFIYMDGKSFSLVLFYIFSRWNGDTIQLICCNNIDLDLSFDNCNHACTVKVYGTEICTYMELRSVWKVRLF